MTGRKTRENLREKAYSTIKQKILRCELMPGTFIIEKQLIDELGVSRTPIREAFNRLEQENLVEIHPNRGIVVTSITVKDISDLYIARETLEPLAARLASSHISQEVIEMFHGAYSCPTRAYTSQEHFALDQKFHRSIANSSQNRYIAKFLLNLYDQNIRIRALSKLMVQDRLEQSRSEHLIIVECFMERDEKGAEAAMKRHILSGKKAALRIV